MTSSTTESKQPDSEALSNNHRTIKSYEGYARKYAVAVSPQPSGVGEEGLRRMVDVVQPGGTILEVGSGPGWDADFVESLGVIVHRTDVTKAFREIQAERGKHVEPLDILTDNFGGPYDAVMALCVLLNIDRTMTDSILQKVAGALRAAGVFLVSIREGEGELWEHGEVSGEYHVVLWGFTEFSQHLEAAGLQVEWYAQSVDSDGSWLTLLARKM